MRAFLALDVPEPIADALDRLQQNIPLGRAARADNLHLTLAFLGDVTDAQLDDLHLDLERLRAYVPRLHVTGFDLFETRAQGLLLAEVAKDPALMMLQDRVQATCRGAGIALPRKRFRPHITLMRGLKRLSGSDRDRLLAWIAANARPDLPDFTAGTVTLYASYLGPDGALHEPLAQYPLIPQAAETT